jgi:hypothetical protein
LFQGKVTREVENAYQTPKLRAVGRESPSHLLSLRKGEGKRHVLLAAGPAASFGMLFRFRCNRFAFVID